MTPRRSDDKVEENRLANAFDLTCKAWQVRRVSPIHRLSTDPVITNQSTLQQRFKVPYTYCGCPLPGDSLGDKLSRLTRKFISSHASPQSALSPPGHPAYAPATHASEHSAIHVRLDDPALAATLARKRREREQTRDERRARDLRRVQKGELDPEVYRRGETHYNAFLTPVPFVWPVGGCVSVGHSQCAAVSC